MTDRSRQMDDASSRRTRFDPQSDRSRSQQMEQSQNSGERHGAYEPDDSRNVTGASGSQGIGSPGGSDQQTGGERWGGQQMGQSQTPNAAGEVDFQADPNLERQGEVEFEPSSQMNQYDSSSGQQMGEIREHMEVIGADGVHLGTVDSCEGDRIKLTKADSGMGAHEGHHHYISRGLVAGVEGDKVRLSATAANAYGMEEEE
jgi:hypothetical protein